MKKLLLLIISTQLFALSSVQKHNLEVAIQTAKLVKCEDGATFEQAVAGIFMQESSGGIQLESADNVSVGMAHFKTSTAKEIIRKTPFLKKYFNHLLQNDKQLIKMLKTSPRFNALLTVYRLKLYYNEAKRLKFTRPYYRAISKHNGGWNNDEYYERVKQRIEFLKMHKIL